MGYSSSLLTDPSAGTGGLALQGINSINQNYANMPNQISAQLSARGFGKSGALGGALYNSENSRLNAQSDFQSQLLNMILGRQQQGANLGQQLLASGRGLSSTGTMTTPNTSLSDGLGGLGKLFGVIGGAKPSSGGYSDTSSGGGNGLPTDGNSGDWGGEFK